MKNLPPCPKCQSALAYEDGSLLICPECGHECSRDASPAALESGALDVRDAHGNVLAADHGSGRGA